MLNRSPNFGAKVLIFLLIAKTISKHFSTLTILTKKKHFYPIIISLFYIAYQTHTYPQLLKSEIH